MKSTMGDTTNTLLLLQVSTRLFLWPFREAKVGSMTLSIWVLDLLFYPQLHQIEVSGGFGGGGGQGGLPPPPPPPPPDTQKIFFRLCTVDPACIGCSDMRKALKIIPGLKWICYKGSSTLYFVKHYFSSTLRAEEAHLILWQKIMGNTPH